jgi:large repetitive protein
MMSSAEVNSVRKIFFILMIMLVASCGNERTMVFTDTVRVSAGSPEVNTPEATLESILSQAATADYREGELLVKFRPGLISASSAHAHRKVGAALLKRLSLLNIEHVKIPQDVDVKNAISLYMQDPAVEYAEPNYLKSYKSFTPTPVIPNDPYFGDQWGLRNLGIFPGSVAGADIRATEAWNIATGTGEVIIAVVDTGIDYDHPDLKDNIWTNPGETCNDGKDNDGNGFINDCRGWNFADKNNSPKDDSGHGTHVAGIIGAAGNNGSGITGVMWNVKLMPLRILNAEGTGTIADEIAAINYAVTMKNRGFNIRVINASFTGGSFSFAEFAAISAANDAGLLLVAAAGNNSGGGMVHNNDMTPQYPANYSLPNVIAVGATDQKDHLAPFSNIGPTTVHVAAPGTFILSTIPSNYGYSSGTSSSSPFVTGLAGLLWTAYPEFTYTQIRGSIFRYVDVLDSLRGQIATGGRINSFRAVSSLLAPADLSAAVTPSNSIHLTWTDNATGEDGYRVERRTGEGQFAEIGVTGPEGASFTDASVSANTPYTYRVSAFNNIAGSRFSNEATAATAEFNPPPSPEPTPQPVRSGGGGGGCSMAKGQTASGSAADIIIIFMPLFVIIAAKYILRKRG